MSDEQRILPSARLKAWWVIELAKRLEEGNPSRAQRALMPKKKRIVSQETRAHISLMLTGRKQSAETRAKRSATLKNTPRTPEW